MLTIDRDAVACPSFMGFGVEWDPGFWHAWNRQAGVTEADWALVTGRVAWMRIPLVRMMMQVKWCRRPDGTYDWETAEMKSLYRHLDVCRKQGTIVFLTDWGCEPGWLRLPDIQKVDDPEYAAAIGTYLDHLLNKKGYTCIKYFFLVNEPNFEVRDWARWKRGLENVSAEFKRRGLNRQVTLVGSDESNDEAWHRNAVDQLQGILGAYDVHPYASADDVRGGRLEAFWRTQWQYALGRDPAAKSKPLVVGEAGIFSPGFSASHNPLHLDDQYGLHMADYAAQAANAGSWAVLAWMLDDSSHQNFTWGMWKNKAGGFALKPWFYPWSLLCRYVPAGATTFRVGAGPDLRVLAARSGSGETEAWTFLLVNRGEGERKVVLRVPDAGPATFRHYLYSRDRAPADGNGFPRPVETSPGDLAQGIEATCPGNSVSLITSVAR